MGRPYSADLRQRVMEAVQSGITYEKVTERYRVSNSTIIRWVRRLRDSGNYAALPMGGKKPFVLSEETEWLLDRFTEKPDLTLRAVLAELHERGIEVSYFAVWNLVRRVRLSFKKRPSMPPSRTVPMSPAGALNGAATKDG
jgi:putative transposase